MRCEDPGIVSGSEMFVDTPSELARDMLYYITSCGRFFTEYGYRISRENYNNYMIFYIIDGRLSVTSDGHTMVADKGKVGFLNCHLPHEYYTIGHTEFLWAHLDGGITGKFYDRLVRLYGGFVFSHPGAEGVREMLSQMVNSYRSGQHLRETEHSRQIYALLTHLLAGGSSGMEKTEEQKFAPAMQFIEKNIGRQISLQDIAGTVNMSHYHFSHLFKKYYGCSPYEYLILERINRAKYMLKTSSLPVKEIAHQVGYPNSSTFTSVFTARVGLSPTTFRKFPL